MCKIHTLKTVKDLENKKKKGYSWTRKLILLRCHFSPNWSLDTMEAPGLFVESPESDSNGYMEIHLS